MEPRVRADSLRSHSSSNSMGVLQNHETVLEVHLSTNPDVIPKRNLLSERSLTIEEL